MLQKFKDIMQTTEDLNQIKSQIEETHKLNSELRKELEILRNQLTELKNSQNEFLKNFREDILSIKNLKEDFAQEIFEFKLLKGQLQKKLLEKFEEELQKDLQINRENLKKDAEDYSELRKKINEIFARLNLTNEEITKFISIGQSIKKEDFELTKFARHLMEMDSEKLNLMRKIDSLERLISKIRRRELIR